MDFMTPHPAIVRSVDTVRLAAAIMRARGVGMLPVVDDLSSPVLCGIITDRDIAIRCVAQHSKACLVRDHMTTTPLATVRADDDISVVLGAMERNQVRRLPVVDHHGNVVGVIAQADVARKAAHADRLRVEHMLEEVSAPHLEEIPC
jgi:CBS domain-containing protein